MGWGVDPTYIIYQKISRNNCVFDMEQFAGGGTVYERRTESLSPIWQVFGGRGSPLAGNRQKPTFKKGTSSSQPPNLVDFQLKGNRIISIPKQQTPIGVTLAIGKMTNCWYKNSRPATTRHEALEIHPLPLELALPISKSHGFLKNQGTRGDQR